MTRMELLAYLSANLFRIYTLFRFTENFFSERKTTVKWIIVSFLICFSINSVCFLCFPMIGVNILSNLIPFFCVTLFYRSKTSVRVLITVIVYSISIFADIALFSVQHLLHLNSVVVSSGVATSLLIFLIERLYEYFFPREKLEKKAEIHIEELLLIIFIPLGSIIIALRGMNHAFEDYLPESIILFAINGIVFYMYDALKKNEKQKIEKMQLQQQNLLYENQAYIKRELQASLYNGENNTKNGILGIVLPNMYDKIFKGSEVCSVCGKSHNIVCINDSTVVKEFSYNYYIPKDGCSWSEEDRFCVLVKWNDFVENPELYINKAFDKRSSLISAKTKVRP